MPYASSVLLSADAREREAELLADLVRLSAATVLLAEPGSDKSAFLRNCVVPLLEATPQGSHAEICVLFDSWGDTPLPALLTEIRRAIPVLDSRRATQVHPSSSLPATLARWQHGLGATFIVVLDRFEDYLVARDQPGALAFEDDFVRVLKTPELRAHFVVALEEDAAPLLEPLRQRVTGFDDAVIRLPRARKERTRQPEPAAARAVAETLMGSPPGKQQPARIEAFAASQPVGSVVLIGSSTPPREATTPAPRLERDSQQRSSTDAPVVTHAHALPRVPRAAWAVLGVLLLSALGLLTLAVWQPTARMPQTAQSPPASPTEAADAATGQVDTPVDEAPPASPADDQEPLPLIAKEVPRRAVAVTPP